LNLGENIEMDYSVHALLKQHTHNRTQSTRTLHIKTGSCISPAIFSSITLLALRNHSLNSLSSITKHFNIIISVEQSMKSLNETNTHRMRKKKHQTVFEI